VKIPLAVGDIGRASFRVLCEHPLGPADYLAIADRFHVFFIEEIPVLRRNQRNEAKRFVTLVDALYEARARLYCSAAARPEQLYPEGDGSFEFARTASRLAEMQSADWPPVDADAD
jgi:cell division protein ZapE